MGEIETYDIEDIIIEEETSPHLVIRMNKNGDCLFSSLAYLIYGNKNLDFKVRKDIVKYVASNWERFKLHSVSPFGEPYSDVLAYVTDMSILGYGTLCEVQAAGEIYSFEFQVFYNGIIKCKFGTPIMGLRRLKFSGHPLLGHFDALVSIA